MAVTNQELFNIFLANPNMSDSQIVTLMETRGISPEQVSSTFGIPVGEVAARVADVIPPNQAVLLGDTYVQAVNQVIGSGEDQQVGALENVITYKASENQVGGNINYYSPTGEYQQTTQQQKVAGSFLEGLGQAITDPVVLAALAGGYGAGLFGGAGALGGAATGTGAGLGTGLTAGAGGLGLSTTGAGLGALGTGAGITAGTGLGTGVLAGSTLGTSLLGAGALTGAGVLGGTTLGATGTGLGTVAGMGTGTGITAGAGGLGLSTTGAGLGAAGTGAGITAGTGLTGTGVLAGSGLGTTLLGTGVGTGLGTGVLTGSGLGTTLAGVGTGVGTGLGTTLAGVGTGVGTRLGTALGTAAGTGLGGLTAAQLGALLSGGLNTGAGLLQQQTSREAAIAAKQMIDRETAAAKQAAQFKPIGMTTRFGASQFGFDPVTGQLTSAGYTLSPEAKNAQDRFVKLAESGLVQAEGAQKAFEPLQTGAQSLFKLGQGYLAEKPETVAENYLKSQMALLQPGRELELANLQTKLRNQGRIGLSVAQGGNLGATTPELQALYNARAQQEAQLAANAQQYGQQNVLFGAGLLGQGSQAMGQYYGGQQAAYSPYTTAMGQVTGLESAAQQPFQMGVDLGKIRASTGFDVGRLGLQGAGQSVALATGPAATTNPYSTLLSGLGASPAFGTAAGSALTSLFG